MSTPADVGRFMTAQLTRDPRLGEGVAEAMQARQFGADPRVPGLGFMFEERPRNGHRVLFKDGDVPGYHGNLALLPEQGFGIYVVVNGEGTDGVGSWAGKRVINDVLDRYFPGGAPVTAVPATGLDRYEGTYRSTRASRSDLSAVTGLTAPVTVEADGDTLVTSGLSPDPAVESQTWVPLGDGLFGERGGQGLLLFDADGVLHAGADPGQAYEKLAWYASPALHLPLLGLGVLVPFLAFLAIPVTALVRRKRPSPGPWSRAAWWAAWLASALVTAFAAGFAAVSGDGNALNEAVMLGAGSMVALTVLVTVTVFATAAVLAGAAGAWWRRWGSVAGRLGYSLIAVSLLAFVTVALTYHLASAPFA
ncbi:hypothetical protein Afil01_15280 [Actinorhabdospora filicis]|uniref:Beta-lactamase n=1 Tax=Actinorhabdospora filicis TaxID=1785913 RepID=A0A9W6SLC8_9ACTN|nr:hypothetical protein Afil01_15280 [Actinorhabdospora filicis]